MREGGLSCSTFSGIWVGCCVDGFLAFSSLAISMFSDGGMVLSGAKGGTDKRTAVRKEERKEGRLILV